jgi:phospholipid/cholesterol/gamma-HCH transport system substrate-binding protein
MRRGGPLVAHPGRAALLSVIVIVAIGVYAFHPSLTEGSRFHLTGLFAGSPGLTTGAPVRVAGYDVGRVTKLDRGPGNTAEVHTTMRIRPRIFLEGGFYIDLQPGAPRGSKLDDGATIPLSQTAIAVQSDQPLSRFDTKARADTATILHEFALALSDGGAQQIRGLTRESPPMLRPSAIVAKASRGLRAGELSELIDNAAAASDALAPVTRELEGVVADGDRTYRALAQHADDLGNTIRQADAALRETPATLRSVDRTLPVLDRYSALAFPVLDRLPRSLRSTSALLTQSSALARPDALPHLLRTLTPTLQRLPTFEERQIPLYNHVEPVSECVTRKVDPVMDAKIDDGPLSTGRPVWLDNMHGMAGSAGVMQNFDANGPYLRYEGGLSDQTVSTGNVPGAGRLVGLTSRPLLGVRPVWNGPTPPPFRPNADCRTQAVPSLKATTGPVPASQPVSRAALNSPKVRKLIARIRRESH